VARAHTFVQNYLPIWSLCPPNLERYKEDSGGLKKINAGGGVRSEAKMNIEFN